MFVPLIALAGLALVGGAINLPFGGMHFLSDWLRPVVSATEAEIDVSSVTQVGLAAIAIVVALAGIAIAAAVHLLHRIDARRRELEGAKTFQERRQGELGRQLEHAQLAEELGPDARTLVAVAGPLEHEHRGARS